MIMGSMMTIINQHLQSLSCLRHNPPMQLCRCRWFRIDSNGPTSLEDFTVSFGVLVLENVQSEDSGTYRCTASNSVGQSQYDIRLEVVEPLRAEISGGDVVVNQGKSTTLRCWFSSSMQATVKWYKDGVAISHRDKYQPIGKDSLRINSMQRTDQGIYQCFVSTERASAQAFVHLILGGTCKINRLDSCFCPIDPQPLQDSALRPPLLPLATPIVSRGPNLIHRWFATLPYRLSELCISASRIAFELGHKSPQISLFDLNRNALDCGG
jgi:Immunoglobulin domain